MLPFLPLVANSFGWIFTEMGRQPWAVFGVMTTANGVSPGVGAGQVATSLIAFTLLYAVLAVDRGQAPAQRPSGAGLPEDPPPADRLDDDADRPLAFAY